MKYLPAVFVAVAAFLWGFQTDATRPITQHHLFWSINAIGLISVLLTIAYLMPRLDKLFYKLLLLVGAFMAWRVSYFPFMVFSGHIASIVEWALVQVPGVPVWVWPTFFVALAGLNTLAVIAVWYLAQPRNWKIYAAVTVPAMVALAISFMTLDDLQLLPDKPWDNSHKIPAVSLPNGNPYLPRVTNAGYTPFQRVHLFAAGNTYATIPESPWARVVKGVLAAEFEGNPVAGSAERVQEHYKGYLSAHRFIGCRYNSAETRCQIPTPTKRISTRP